MYLNVISSYKCYWFSTKKYWGARRKWLGWGAGTPGLQFWLCSQRGDNIVQVTSNLWVFSLLQNERKWLNQIIFKPLSKYKYHSFLIKKNDHICHILIHNHGDYGTESLKTDCLSNNLIPIADYSSLKYIFLLCTENTRIYLFIDK